MPLDLRVCCMSGLKNDSGTRYFAEASTTCRGARLRSRKCGTYKTLPVLRTNFVMKITTDHMILATYDPVTGWSAPEIKPYGPLTLDPLCSCFQYSTNLFEGMKVRSRRACGYIAPSQRVYRLIWAKMERQGCSDQT